MTHGASTCKPKGTRPMTDRLTEIRETIAEHGALDALDAMRLVIEAEELEGKVARLMRRPPVQHCWRSDGTAWCGDPEARFLNPATAAEAHAVPLCPRCHSLVCHEKTRDIARLTAQIEAVKVQVAALDELAKEPFSEDVRAAFALMHRSLDKALTEGGDPA